MFADALDTAEVQAQIDGLRSADQRIRDDYPPVRMLAGIREKYDARRRARRMVLIPAAATGGVVLLALALWVVVPVNRDLREDTPSVAASLPYEGIKGGMPGLSVFRNGEDGQEEMADGAMASKGDVLQLAFSTGGAQSLLVCSVDGRGTVTRHYPQEKENTLVTPGQRVLLPFAFELDDAPGYEKFFLVWSTEPAQMDVAAVCDLLARGTRQDGATRLPDGLLLREFTVRKPSAEEQ